MHCRFVRLSLKKLRRKRDRRVSTSKVGRCSAASLEDGGISSLSSSRFRRSSSSSLGDEDDDEEDEEGLSISEASQSLPEINPEPPTHIVLLDIVQDPTR